MDCTALAGAAFRAWWAPESTVDDLDARSGDVLYRFNAEGPIGGGIVSYGARPRQ